MIRVVLFVLLLWPGLAFSQEGEAHNTLITRIVHVRYVDAEKVANLIHGNGHVSLRGDNTLKAIAITGFPPDVSAAEQTIKELDVPTAVQNTSDANLL